jgi:HK97 family phage portal protein
MFDFTWIKKGKIENVMESISADITELQISKLAIEKAVNMIAKAVAKSEFVVQRKNGRVKDDIYYMLNVKANENETATDFWIEVVKKLLTETECVICRIGKSLYIADTWNVDTSVMLRQKYTNITITSNGNSMPIDKALYANEVMHLRARNEKIKTYLQKALGQYDKILNALSEAKRIASTPKFELRTQGVQQIMRTKNPDGTEKIVTEDEYKNKIKKLLTSDKVEIISNQDTLSVGELKITNNVSTEDLTKIAHEIFVECALAFDIPKAVFLGEITEKADSTNEFITYAVSWVVEVINDSLNAKLVGQADYLKGEKIWIDMSGYKHVDIIESAANLDKLRAIGFSLDEIFRMVGWEELGTEFSTQRVVTKNYTNDLTTEKNST